MNEMVMTLCLWRDAELARSSPQQRKILQRNSFLKQFVHHHMTQQYEGGDGEAADSGWSTDEATISYGA